MVGKLRAGLRLLYFGGMTSLLILGYSISAPFSRDKFKLSVKFRRWWMHLVPGAIGLRTIRKGERPDPDRPAMFVSNHRSYIDPVLLLRFVDARPLSKAEVRRWPIVGLAAAITGTLFVDRGNTSSRVKARDEIKAALLRGESIMNFPEGTTSTGETTLPFRPALFQVAARLGIPVVPVAILYDDEGDAWVGEDRFLRHFFQMFAKPRITHTVSFGPLLSGRDAGLLLEQSRSWINTELSEHVKP